MTRSHTFSRWFIAALSALLLLQAPLARAEVVNTDELTTLSQAEQDQAKIQSFVERASVKEKLEALGVSGLIAQHRVSALTPQEAHALAERIDAMPAGGTLSQMDMVVILLIAILVAIAV